MPDVAALSNADGRFELSTPVAGRYTVGLAMEGYGPSSVTVDVEAEQPADIDITLEPAG